MKRALILVDLQNDFMPGGTLPVPAGNEVVPIANALANDRDFDLVVATPPRGARLTTPSRPP